MRRGTTALLRKRVGDKHAPPTPLASCLPLPLRERVGVRGIWSGMISRCHSFLFLLVIPNVSHPVIPDFSHAVIPDVIHRESKAGVRGDRGSRRSLNLLGRLHHGIEGKRPWIPAN